MTEHSATSTSLDTENAALRKQLRNLEAEGKMNKAMLEQKIEILEMQNQEFRSREDSLKKMNESIMSALNNVQGGNNPQTARSLKDLESINETLTKELNDYKIRSQETIKTLEKDNKDYKEKNQEFEGKYNQMVLRYEKNELSFQQRISHLENERKNMGVMMKLYEEEKKQFKEKENVEFELHSKIGELKFMLERQRDDHKKDTEKMQHDHNQLMTNLKRVQDAEKSAIELQMNKHQETTRQESKFLEDLRKSYNEELVLVKTQRDEGLRKIESLEKHIKSLNEIMKGWEEKILQTRIEAEQEEKQYHKLREKVADLEGQLKKGDSVEKHLRHALAEKEHQIEDVKLEYRKKINAERKRFEQAQELSKKYKEENTKKSTLILQENLKKDELIKKLKTQLTVKQRETERLTKKSGDTTQTHPDKNTNASLVNISGVSSSIHFLKRDEGKDAKESARGNRILPKLDSPEIDDLRNLTNLTNDHIIFGFSSPRVGNTANTCRNGTSGKRDFEFPSASSTRNGHRKDEKSLVNIHLNETNNDLDISKEEDMPTARSQLRIGESNMAACIHTRSTSSTVDIKRRFLNVPQDRQAAMNSNNGHFLLEQLKFISYLECELCKGNYGLADFLEHITTCTNSHAEKAQATLHNQPSYSDFLNSPQNVSGNTLDISAVRHKGSVYNINPNVTVDNINSEMKKQFEERLRDLEDQIRETDNKYEKVKIEKDKVQVELDRIILELKQTKMEWALSEERKEECELTLKNEIKFLINKLIQVKGQNPNLSGIDLSMLKSNGNTNKSVLENNSSFYNNSYFATGHTSHHHTNMSMGAMTSFSSHPHEQTALNIINNNLSEHNKSKVQKTEGKENVYGNLNLRYVNSGNKIYYEKDELVTNPADSPRRVSEFANDNSLLQNMHSTTTHPKKLIKNLKN